MRKILLKELYLLKIIKLLRYYYIYTNIWDLNIHITQRDCENVSNSFSVKGNIVYLPHRKRDK